MMNRYLSPSHDSFWQWQDRGEVLTWPDGKTIAFREEIRYVLSRHAERGLPPFGAVVLLLGALRDDWEVHCQQVINFPAWSAQLSVTLGKLMGQLDRVAALPPDLRHSLEAKAVLAEMVFEECKPRLPVDESTKVLQILSQRWDDEARPSTSEWVGLMSTDTEISCLLPALPKVDEQALRARLQTGLDEVPEPAPVEIPPAQRVRALLTELENDEELHGLARLARRLMAATTLPRPMSAEDDLQLGGIADLTNRGPLDRLLLSELAHDDLTLAVRVAMNEALYWKRESPPKNPPHERSVFLEAGIRSWGVPRVFATAVALALAGTTERNQQTVTYRASGENVDSVELTTREGILAHLASLEPETHPGRALESFQAILDASEETAEPILVTTDDTAADPEFQHLLASKVMPPYYLVTVNRIGDFRLWEKNLRGSKLLREAHLDLEDLFRKPVVPQIIDKERSGDFPAIFSVKPFPLYLSHNIDSKRLWYVEHHGVLALTKDRRLTLWTETTQGAQQISDTVPKGPLWWASCYPVEDRVQAVVGHPTSHAAEFSLLDIDLAEYQCRQQRLQIESGLRGICSHNGGLFAIYSKQVQVLNPNNGEVLQTLRLTGGSTLARDRFFRWGGSGDWYAISFDGTKATFESVIPSDQGSTCPKLMALFDRPGVDGPIAVTSRGDLYQTATGKIEYLEHSLSGELMVLGISRNGKYLALTRADFPHRPLVIVNTLTRDVSTYSNETFWTLEPEARYSIRPTAMRHRFTHICVDQRGMLVLTSRKQHRFGIVFDTATEQIVLEMNPTWHGTRERVAFQSVPSPAGTGYHLSKASWQDGSEAWLDSRGMLHLRSADHSIPEMTIVLTDHTLAGWCSDGFPWGPEYFTGDLQERVMPSYVFDTTLRNFAEKLR